MGRRKASREIALHISYMMKYCNGISLAKAVQKYRFCLHKKSAYYKYDKEVYKFALYLLKEAKKNSDNINLIIKVSSDNWKIEHIGLVEKCIIDIAIAEFLDKGNNIPFKATISEAVLLAIKYGGKDSKSYVNGVLDKAAELTGAKSKE